MISIEPFLLGIQAAAASASVVTLPSISFDSLFTAILNFFFDVAGGDYRHSIDTIITGLKFFSTLLSLFFIAGTVYAKVKVAEIDHKVDQRYKYKIEPTPKEVKNEKWEAIVNHANSVNPNDWRLAILEADIMLDDMLKDMGAFGDTLGDRLKSTTPAQLPSLQKAWEAHLVRNKIAHEGADFTLSQHEARRVIGLFQQVFQEGGVI